MIEKRVLELEIGGCSKLIATKTLGEEGISLEVEIREPKEKETMRYVLSVLGLEDFIEKVREWRST